MWQKGLLWGLLVCGIWAWPCGAARAQEYIEAGERTIDSLRREFAKPHTQIELETIGWQVFGTAANTYAFVKAQQTLAAFAEACRKHPKRKVLLPAVQMQMGALVAYTTQRAADALPYLMVAMDACKQARRHDLMLVGYSHATRYLYRGHDYEGVDRLCREADQLLARIKLNYSAQGIGHTIINIVDIYNNWGLANEKMGRYQQAIACFEKSIEYARKVNHLLWVGIARGNMGSVYHAQGQWAKAVELLAIDVRESIRGGDLVNAAISSSEMAEIFDEQGQRRKARAQFDTTMTYLAKLDSAHLFHWPAFTRTYRRLSTFYERQGMHRQALLYYKLYQDKTKRYDAYQEGLETKRIQRAYDVEKSQRALALAQKDKALLAAQSREEQAAAKRNFWIAAVSGMGLLGFAGFSVLLFWRGRQFKNANLQIARQVEAIGQANTKLKELGQFKQLLVGSLVHDLKNPLALIIQKAQDAQLVYASRQMMNLVMNVLEVEKFEEMRLSLRLQTVELEPLVQSVIAQTAYLAERKNMRVVQAVPPGLAAQADYALLERILINLITNALKHTPPNGRVAIESAEATLPTGGAGLALTVSDNGPGIAPEHLPHLFDKFFNIENGTQSALRSTGLGLTFCKLATEAHGGSITVQSAPGLGTVFKVVLPLAATATQEAQALPTSELPALTEAEMRYLAPFVAQLQQKEVYEYSAVNAILAQMERDKSTAISHWITQLKNTLTTCNEPQYQQLLNLARSPLPS